VSGPECGAPRVSVLIPAHNAASTIEQAVVSALTQTISDLEVIVVDDGSLRPVAGSLDAVHDPRLQILRTARNRGVAAARNTALAAARAPVVAQLDADDWWQQSHLAGLLEALEDPGVGLAYANAEVIGHPQGLDRWIDVSAPGRNPARSVTVWQPHPVRDLATLYQGNPIPSPGVAMRTAAARAVGGYPEWLTVGEDWLLYMRLLRTGWRFSYVDRRSAVYRWPESRRGATFNRQHNAREAAKLFALLALASPRERAIRVRLAGELANIVSTHVPGSLSAWHLISRQSVRRPFALGSHAISDDRRDSPGRG
jgi:glycosyltransferase involved in cell wall biosynthesis